MTTEAQGKQTLHSHSSQYFNGADAVHKGGLLLVRSGHEVSHVGGYGPGLSSEVGLVVDDHLEMKSESQGVTFQ